MSKIPIEIQKIKTYSNLGEELLRYLIVIRSNDSKFDLSYVCSRDELIKFRKLIDQLLENSSLSEILNIPHEKAVLIEEANANDKLCNGCDFQRTQNCVDCLFVMQSPLERKLFVELKKSYIHFHPQYAMNWKGQKILLEGRSYDNPNYNFKEVMTVVDFYIQKGSNILCVYTDGHSYHERTEAQAKKDRRVDRQLQNLGFHVLRYTGKEVNENIKEVIKEIDAWINK
ncbi:DUF559 domain-containing protein [Ornithobacterium rhinotracheale]|uniref:endonuclease domain-containing protein n=1 Tax=Ornithobacterium rhinotracheale TaxID=28251 RepID=UPI00129CC6D3|nr:DUF559 domain-containing protein [Ornithobacterium rhinotracheale]MRJ09884.1 DUF559 domain-containing protein [Ornithobacterium rhinotracheale]